MKFKDAKKAAELLPGSYVVIPDRVFDALFDEMAANASLLIGDDTWEPHIRINNTRFFKESCVPERWRERRAQIMDRWFEFKNGQYPRRGELFMVKSSAGIYPRLLIAEDSLKWWVYLKEDAENYKNGKFSGTQLSFHGVTHWTLLHSDY